MISRNNSKLTSMIMNHNPKGLNKLFTIRELNTNNTNADENSTGEEEAFYMSDRRREIKRN